MAEDFFDNQTASSRIKAMIVSQYFPKYCNIILKKGQTQIRYVDLFAGPGKYNDGNFSTPILVGKEIAKDAVLKDVVKFIFNDGEKKYVDALKSNFDEHFPEGTFLQPVAFGNVTVGEHEKTRQYLLKSTHKNGKNVYPTLLFIDPFGYKGVDTEVLATFMKNWGNEVFLFVNIKRIHAAVENGKFDEIMNELFPSTIDTIRTDRKYKAKVDQRLTLIIENLAKEFQTRLSGTLYYTAFKFQEEDSNATSHYILHFTKHNRGYDLVKQIYSEFDNIGAVLDQDGTYTFDAKKLESQAYHALDFGDQNVVALRSMLVREYAGQKISAWDLFDIHQMKTKFSRKHYTNTLRQMVADNEIVATFTDNGNHTVTVLISPTCKLQFK